MNFSLSSKTPQTLINEIENKLKYFSVDQLYNLNFMLLCELSKKGNTQSTKYETLGYNKFENLMNNQRFEEVKEIEINFCSNEEKKNNLFLKNKRERDENVDLKINGIEQKEENKENELYIQNEESNKILEENIEIEYKKNNGKISERIKEKDNIMDIKNEDIEEKKDKEKKEDHSFKLRTINYFNYNKLNFENIIYPQLKK